MAVLPTGVQLKAFAQIESAFDTTAANNATHAVPLISLEFTPTGEFHKTGEMVGSASLQREVAGTKGGTWSASFYAKPNGTSLTTEPDCGAFFEAAFGAKDTSGDVSYRMHDGSNEVTATQSLQITRVAGTKFTETINGAWVEQFDVEVVGNAETVVNVSGGFSSIGWCYGSTIAAVSSTSATTFDIQSSGRAERFGAGAQIQFNDAGTVQDNSGAGWLVTGVSGDTITINAATGVTLGAGTNVHAHDLAQTLTTNSPSGE